MVGAVEPFNREPMKWDWANETNEQYNFTRELVNMRRYHRALRIGDFDNLHSFSLLAFMRRTDRIAEMIIVLAAREGRGVGRAPLQRLRSWVRFGGLPLLAGASPSLTFAGHLARMGDTRLAKRVMDFRSLLESRTRQALVGDTGGGGNPRGHRGHAREGSQNMAGRLLGHAPRIVD